MQSFLWRKLQLDEKEKSNIMKNVLIIGLGRFGKHIAMQLNQLGHEIMAVDWKEERVDKVLPFVTNAQIGDSTNEEFFTISWDWKLRYLFRDYWRKLSEFSLRQLPF